MEGMKKISRFFIILLFLFAGSVWGQQTDSTYYLEDEEYYEDTEFNDEYSNIEQSPYFSFEDTIRQLRQQNDYAYMTYLDSLLRHQKYNEEVVKERSDPAWATKGLEWILWITGGSALIYLLVIIFRERVFNGGNAPIARAEEVVEKKRIRTYAENYLQAEKDGEFRLAVRYLFLDVLQQMEASQLVLQQKDITNQQYLAQLKNPETKNQFRDLMVLFEYVWYGEAHPDAEQYYFIKEKFKDFKARWIG